MADQFRSDHESRTEPKAGEIARRNREALGRPLSPVMKTALTACELARADRTSASEAPRR